MTNNISVNDLVTMYRPENRAANDLLFAPREELLSGSLWRGMAARHGLTVEDFDWIVEHCRAQRSALDGVHGFAARGRVMAQYLRWLLERFGADERTAAIEWRSLMEPTLEGSMARCHDNERINDIRFIVSIIDSLTR